MDSRTWMACEMGKTGTLERRGKILDWPVLVCSTGLGMLPEASGVRNQQSRKKAFIVPGWRAGSEVADIIIDDRLSAATVHEGCKS